MAFSPFYSPALSYLLSPLACSLALFSLLLPVSLSTLDKAECSCTKQDKAQHQDDEQSG